MHPEWVRSIRDQCVKAGVAFHFKQFGDWARSVRDQCVGAGVPFFFKQWGAWAPHHPVAGGDLGGDVHSGRVTIVHPTGQSDIEVFAASGRNTVPGSRFMERLGKKAAGRMLDGVEWSMWPEVVVGE